MGGPGSGRKPKSRPEQYYDTSRQTGFELYKHLALPVVQIANGLGVIIYSRPKQSNPAEYETYVLAPPLDLELQDGIIATVTVAKYYPTSQGPMPSLTTVPASLARGYPKTGLSIWSLKDTDRYEFVASVLPKEKRAQLKPGIDDRKIFFVRLQGYKTSGSVMRLPVASPAWIAAANIPMPDGLAFQIVHSQDTDKGVALLRAEDRIYLLGFDTLFYPDKMTAFLHEAGL